MTKYYDVFSDKEIRIIKEVLESIRTIFKEETNVEAKIFLIGMKALYFYFGKDVFLPSPISLDIDINFDILLDWVNYRKIIPQRIKIRLENKGYNVETELGLITIQKEGILIHLTTVIEYSKEYIGATIPELNLDVGDKNFLIYSKLSRFNQYKDKMRLENLFKNCKLDTDKILDYAPEIEKDIIKDRINLILK